MNLKVFLNFFNDEYIIFIIIFSWLKNTVVRKKKKKLKK